MQIRSQNIDLYEIEIKFTLGITRIGKVEKKSPMIGSPCMYVLHIHYIQGDPIDAY